MPAPTDWITTARQAGPRFLSLMMKLQPTFHLSDINSLDPHFLARHNISALLWDVDGTLMPHHDRLLAPRVDAALSSLRNLVPQAILSNCGEARFQELGEIFSLPILRGYSVDGSFVVRRLERGRDLWKAGGSPILRPSGFMAALNKPSGQLIGLALDELEVPVEQRPLALMVGDQHFTDVAGANLAGIRSAKVRTMAPRSFPFPLRCLHVCERVIYRAMRGPTTRGQP
jgi:predicted HAD superfamily phosphohydrolase YqeG